MKKSTKNKSLLKVITVVTMFAMVISMSAETPFQSPFVGELVGDFVGSVYANDDAYGDPDDDPRRPNFYAPPAGVTLNSRPARAVGPAGAPAARPAMAGNTIPGGERVPAGFFPGTGTTAVELRHREGWQIIYTVSVARDNETMPLNTPSPGVNFDHARLARHNGGVSPLLTARCGGADPNSAIASNRCDNCFNRLYRAPCRRIRPVHPPQRNPAAGTPVASGRLITFPNDACAISISMVAVNPAGGYSDVITRSWINIGKYDFYFNEDLDPVSQPLIFHINSDAREIFHSADTSTAVSVIGVDRAEWVTRYIAINASLADNAATRTNIRNQMGSPILQGNYPPLLPAGFTRRGRGSSEIAAHVEIFNHLGNRIANQRAGMRIKGGWSRATFVNEQKTWEFYANDNYGDRNNFLWPLFGQLNAQDGNLMHRFRRFRIRNGGSDREGTFMRDELAHDLARLSGYPDMQNHRPGVVFLNGAYYGMVWLKSPRTEDHWRRFYGGRTDAFEKIGPNEMGRDTCGRGGCLRVLSTGQSSFTRPAPGTRTLSGTTFTDPHSGSPASVQHPAVCAQGTCGRIDCSDFHSSFNPGCAPGVGNCRGVTSWAQVTNLLAGSSRPNGPNGDEIFNAPVTANLTNAAAWDEFSRIVNVDSVIRYYSLQIFAANVDWPSNNVEMWRYFPICANGNDHQPGDVCDIPGCEIAAIRAGTLHPYLDGRWNMVAQDLEFGWGHFMQGAPIANATHPTSNTIHALINRTGTDFHVPGALPSDSYYERDSPYRFHFNAMPRTSLMIPSLMQRPDMRAAFANALNDLRENSHGWIIWCNDAEEMVPGPAQLVRSHLAYVIEEEHRRMAGQSRTGTLSTNTAHHAAGRQTGRGAGGAPHWTDENWDLARQRSPRDTIRISELPRAGGVVSPHNQSPAFPHPHGLFNAWAIDERDQDWGFDTHYAEFPGQLHLLYFLYRRSWELRDHIAEPFVPGRPQSQISNSTPATGLGLADSARQEVWAGISGNIPWERGGDATLNTLTFGLLEPQALGAAWCNETDRSRDPRIRGEVHQGFHFAAGTRIPLTIRPWAGFRIQNISGENLIGAADAIGQSIPQRLYVTGASNIYIQFERIPEGIHGHGLPHVSTIQANRGGPNDGGNWIEITNSTAAPLSTRGLYLSDNWDGQDEDTADHDRIFDFRWRMPAFIIDPGQTVFLQTNNTNETRHTALKHAQTNFGITFGERIRIADSAGNVIQRVEVSRMTSSEAQQRNPDGNWRIVDWADQSRNQGNAPGMGVGVPCTGTCQTCGCPICFPPAGRCDISTCFRCFPPAHPPLFNLNTTPATALLNLNGAGGSASGQVAAFPWLTRNGSAEPFNVNATPTAITITNRGGSAQGVQFRLNAITSPRPAGQYTFTITGTLAGGGHPGRQVAIRVGGSSGEIVGQTTTGAGGAFTVTATLTGAQVASLDSPGHATRGRSLALWTADGNDNLTITQMTITRD
ncbi:MAG: CotH kinase family protein [Oscillospiraceae bacterium]|nr:CotH kinase family protein [Oscillospiraceae bacterium]